MNNPLVSIIVPAFNSGEYIVQSVNSALAQEYSPVEIIVIDDGSTDDTHGKIAELEATGKVRYQSQNNRGLPAARNAGLELAHGKYIQFLDADDLLEPTKLAKQVEQLEKASAPSISGSDFRFFNDFDTQSLYGGDSFNGCFPLTDAARLFDFHTVIHRWLFPASLLQEIGGFDENMPATEDWMLLWKLAARGTEFLYVNEPLALYRKHSQAMTADFERLATGHLLAIEGVSRYQKEHGVKFYSTRLLNGLRESYHYDLALHLLRANRIARAWLELMKACFLSSNRRQVKLLLIGATPALRSRALDWVGTADDRLWRLRAQLRRTFVG